ncbi:MAG: peroxiredoxin [[Mycobacterium] stephanolepidis]
MLPVGTIAPDFTLRNQNNQPVSLSDFRGKKAVLLVFFPLAFTGVCQGELDHVRDRIGDFENDDVQIIGLSVSAGPIHKIWSSYSGFTFPILSDFWPHGAVAEAYGVLNEKAGYPNRGTFVVDADGIIRFAEMLDPGQARDQAGWVEALAALHS